MHMIWHLLVFVSFYKLLLYLLMFLCMSLCFCVCSTVISTSYTAPPNGPVLFCSPASVIICRCL